MISNRTLFFNKAETREQREYRFLVYVGIVFYIIGIFIEGFKLGGYEPRCALNGLIILLLGHFIKYQSRSICILAILYSSIGIAVSVLNLRGHSVSEWGMSVVTLLLILSVSAFIIVSKYHYRVCSKVIWKHVLQKSFLSLIYASIVFFGLVYWIACWVDTFGNVGYYDLISYNFYVMLVFIPIMLTFKGWFPFTKNKPLVYLGEQSGSESTILKIQSHSKKDELSTQAVLSGASEINRHYNSIGGWLFLPVVGLIITFLWEIFRNYHVFATIYPMDTQYFQQAFTSVDIIKRAELFGELMGITVSLGFYLLSFIFDFFVINCFFRRKKITPKLMVVYYLINFVSAMRGIGIVAVSALFEALDIAGRNLAVVELGIALFSLIIWGSYFIFSKRVKGTFVK